MTFPLWLSAKLAVIEIVSPAKNDVGDLVRSPLSGPVGVVAAIDAWVRVTEPIMTPTTAAPNTDFLSEILMAHLPGARAAPTALIVSPADRLPHCGAHRMDFGRRLRSGGSSDRLASVLATEET